MNYRIEHDRSATRESFGDYTYRIYEGDRLIATYWHDYRGDEHGIDFVDGSCKGGPVGRMTEFIEGGGSEPLRLSDSAVAYLKERQS